MKCFSWASQQYHRDKSLDDWNSLFLMTVFLICAIQTKVFIIQPCNFYLSSLFSFANKTNLKLFSTFPVQVWRNPRVTSRDFLQNCAALCATKLGDNLKDTGCSVLSIYTWLTENSQEKGCSCLARKYPHPIAVDSSNFFETLFEKHYFLIFILYSFQVIVKFSKHVW